MTLFRIPCCFYANFLRCLQNSSKSSSRASIRHSLFFRNSYENVFEIFAEIVADIPSESPPAIVPGNTANVFFLEYHLKFLRGFLRRRFFWNFWSSYWESFKSNFREFSGSSSENPLGVPSGNLLELLLEILQYFLLRSHCENLELHGIISNCIVIIFYIKFYLKILHVKSVTLLLANRAWVHFETYSFWEPSRVSI